MREGESQVPLTSRGAWLGLDGRWFSGSALGFRVGAQLE